MTTVDELLPDCQQLHTRLRAFSTVANRKISDTDASSQIPQLQAVGQSDEDRISAQPHGCLENVYTYARWSDFGVVSRSKTGDDQWKNPIWLIDSVARTFPQRFSLARLIGRHRWPTSASQNRSEMVLTRADDVKPCSISEISAS